LNEGGISDDELSIHTYRNQSLSNAIYRLGNWAGHLIFNTSDDASEAAMGAPGAELPMERAWADWILRGVQVALLALLWVSGWRAARRGDDWATAVSFALASLMMPAISPVFRGHYYVFWAPAVWLIPTYFWRQGRMRLAINLVYAACALGWAHYALLSLAG